MEFLTVLNAAKLLNRSPETVRLYEKTGRLKARRSVPGTDIFISPTLSRRL